MFTNPIQWMALIFLVIASIKILVLLISPKEWANVAIGAYSNPMLLTIVSFIGAAVTFYYLAQAGVGLLVIFAVMLFLAFLMGLSIAVYSKEMSVMATKLLQKRDFLKRGWFALLIWIVLIILGFFLLFGSPPA